MRSILSAATRYRGLPGPGGIADDWGRFFLGGDLGDEKQNVCFAC